jgi:hypothetical protein
MGVKSGNKSVGFTFAGMWVLGLISAGILAFMIAENFDARARDKQQLTITQPVSGKLIIKVPDSKVKVYGRWFKMDGLLSMTDDSLVLNNVRIHLVKSNDSLFHMDATKYSNGSDESSALHNIKEMNYGISQQDSTVWLDRGFSLQRGTKFRNQGVVVTIYIPIGKRILLDRTVQRRLNHFELNNGHNDWDSDEDWDNNFYGWDSDVEYKMTAGGLERTDKKQKSVEESNNDENNSNQEALDNYKKSKEELKKEYEKKQKEAEDLKKELEKPIDSTQYHYKKVTAIIAPAVTEDNTQLEDILDSHMLLMQMVL